MSRNWKRVYPNTLVDALRLCKDHALEKRRLSVERIAELMGVSPDVLYKWLSTGRMPAALISGYEHICGIDLATRYLASSSGRLLIDIPTGRNLVGEDMTALHSAFADATKLLNDFYAGRANQAETLEALTHHMQQVAWHHGNVTAHTNPQLELSS